MLTVRPIGRVQRGAIRLHKRLAAAVDGIEGFSHLFVIFWLHQAHSPDIKIHSKAVKGSPAIGCLATRTPHRFNPIGVTVVSLLRRRSNILYVKGLDAHEGTLVLDIKPYTKKDSIRNFRMPDWVRLLDKAEKDPLRRYASCCARISLYLYIRISTLLDFPLYYATIALECKVFVYARQPT